MFAVRSILLRDGKPNPKFVTPTFLGPLTVGKSNLMIPTAGETRAGVVSQMIAPEDETNQDALVAHWSGGSLRGRKWARIYLARLSPKGHL
jgi:hypothetical protein